MYFGADRQPPDALVVYCAHDAVYSEALLRDFTRQTGIPVRVRFDTEATKSLGLAQQILQEQSYPRCDVFWNNQLQSTLDLVDHDVLLPYQGPGYQATPVKYRDVHGRWTGFAARLRVWIVNHERISDWSEPSMDGQAWESVSRFAMANPLYGTTRSHLTVLWHVWGGPRLKQWFDHQRQRGMLVVNGNATVKNLVALGKCDYGWTDTDDFFVALDDGHPVHMYPIRVAEGRTICIPNTVAIVRGSRRLSQAKQLVDFLLSPSTQLALAKSSSRQIPLCDFDSQLLPADVQPLYQWAQQAVDLTQLGDARVQCLRWLARERLE